MIVQLLLFAYLTMMLIFIYYLVATLFMRLSRRFSVAAARSTAVNPVLTYGVLRLLMML